MGRKESAGWLSQAVRKRRDECWWEVVMVWSVSV